MKSVSSKLFVMVSILFLLFYGGLQAGDWPRTGIGIRGNFWDVTADAQHIRVHNHWDDNHVDVGGFGGTLFFFTQIYPRVYLDFTIGAIGQVRERTVYWDQEEVDANAIVPVLFGIRYHLLPDSSPRNLQPYLSAGVGAYWLNDIHVIDNYDYEEEVTIKSDTRPGGYGGIGLNFMLSEKFAINYEMRYHMVDFQRDDYENGFEFGIGFSFMWGELITK